MDNIISRKYNSGFRKSIKQKISKLVDKDDFVCVYKIINIELESKISINRNGIYFNLNLLSDNCIEKLDSFLDEKIITKINKHHEKASKIKFEFYTKNSENNSEYLYGQKLTNQEKTLIKKFNYKET